jgi:hypothetical protein
LPSTEKTEYKKSILKQEDGDESHHLQIDRKQKSQATSLALFNSSNILEASQQLHGQWKQMAQVKEYLQDE